MAGWHARRGVAPTWDFLLDQFGPDVDYREFNGAHAVPSEIALEGARWFLDA